MAIPLHQVMAAVLRDHGGAMASEDLAAVIAGRDLYRREDGSHPPADELRAHAAQHPRHLEAADDSTGRIGLSIELAGPPLGDLAIFCADVGSVKTGNFGWAQARATNADTEPHDASRPSHLASAVVDALEAGRAVALGFECPLFVPVHDDELALGRARQGEGNRSCSAGAGTGAMATGARPGGLGASGDP